MQLSLVLLGEFCFVFIYQNISIESRNQLEGILNSVHKVIIDWIRLHVINRLKKLCTRFPH